jgi:hypothetical protein
MPRPNLEPETTFHLGWGKESQNLRKQRRGRSPNVQQKPCQVNHIAVSRCSRDVRLHGNLEPQHACRIAIKDAFLDVVRIAEFIPLSQQACVGNAGIIAAE